MESRLSPKPYGYVKDPDNKDFWIIDEEAAEVVRLIFPPVSGRENRKPNRRISDAGANPNPHFLHERARGGEPVKTRTLNEDNRCKWNKATLKISLHGRSIAAMWSTSRLQSISGTSGTTM